MARDGANGGALLAEDECSPELIGRTGGWVRPPDLRAGTPSRTPAHKRKLAAVLGYSLLVRVLCARVEDALAFSIAAERPLL